MEFPLRHIFLKKAQSSLYNWINKPTENIDVSIWDFNSPFINSILIKSNQNITAKFVFNQGIEIPLKINDVNNINLPYFELTFVDKVVKISVPLTKTKREEAFAIIEEVLFDTFKSKSCGFKDELDFWDDKAIEFLLEHKGICEDYPKNGKESHHNHISRDIAPCIYEKFTETTDGCFPCSISMRERVDGLFWDREKIAVDCPDKMEGCLVAHYKFNYYMNDEQLSLRKEYNSNTFK